MSDVERDEVKQIRDKAQVLRTYARLANDRDMLIWVSEIRLQDLGSIARSCALSMVAG